MKNKLPLLLILFIGVVTPLASTALFFVWRPAEQTNHGEILPPLPPPAARRAGGEEFSLSQWRGYWVLLAAGGGDCGEKCRQRLCRMRQLRLMLPGNYLRLRRAWLVTDEQPPPAAMMEKSDCGEVADPALSARAATTDSLDGVEMLFGEAAGLPPAPRPAADYLYLLDPSGVWAMRFSPELTPYQIRQDMARLLKLSKGIKLKR